MGAGIVRMVGMAATFGVGVQLARYLGPDGVGIYGTVLSIMAVASVVAQLGLPQLLTREVAVHAYEGSPGRAKGAIGYFSLAISLASLVGIVIGYAILLFTSGVSSVFGSACLWGLPLIPLMALTNLAVGGIRGAGQEWAAQVFDALLRPVLFGVLLFAAYQLLPNLGPVATVQIQTAVVAVGLVVSFIVFARYLPPEVLHTHATRHGDQWKQSAAPMVGSEILRIVDGNYPILLMGAIASDADVGVLRIALAMAAMIGVVSSLINVVVMPRAAAYFASGNRDQLQHLASSASAVMVCVAVLATGGVLLVGRPVISFVFGQEFLSAWSVLLIFSIAYCVNGFTGSTASILNMCGHEHVVTRAFLIGLVVSVLVTYGFYYVFGISSAGIGVVVSELVKGVILWGYSWQQLKIDTSALAFLVRRNQQQTCKVGSN